MLPALDASSVGHVAVAALGALAIGLERQQSGHADGPRARFAGLRTFTLLGLGSGLSGWLWTAGGEIVAAVILAGFAALTVTGYVRASGSDVDGTTEVAALVVMAAGVISGAGAPAVASAIFAVTAFLLAEKHRLHGWVRAIDSADIRAGARFGVLAAVVLPLLPEGPFGPFDTIRPRLLWALVLFFSGLSFLGVIARRLLGAGRGYLLAGLVGGLLSSTSVTLTYARLSRVHPEHGRALAGGALAANAVLFPRVLLASATLAWPLAAGLWPAFAVPAALALAAAAMLAARPGAETSVASPDTNPLQLGAALQMAAVFQVVLLAVAVAKARFGQAGIYGSAAVLGLADVDALTVSMAEAIKTGTLVDVATTALTIGILANSLVKAAIAGVVGRGAFRALTVGGLLAIAGALGGALLLRR